MNSLRNVLMVDIPTYFVELPENHKNLLKTRVSAQVKLWQDRVGINMIKGGLPYSRGLLTLAASLERHSFSVQYLIHSDPVDRALIPEYAKEADFLCIYVMTPTLHIAVSLCDVAKNINPKIVTILGGPHIESRPRETLQGNANVDFVMIGEVDDRLPVLLNSIKQPDSIGGTVYRLPNGDVQMSGAPLMPVVVSELPMPAYHLLRRPFQKYSHHIKTYRGCPYECNFCVDRKSWKSVDKSAHTLDQVIDELRFFSKRLQPATLVHFSDSILNLRWENRTQELIDRIKKADLGLYFAFDTRVDLIESAQVKALVDAGFIYFRMGFESVHDNVLQISHKSSTRDKEWDASRIIRSVSQKAAIHAYILTGLPGTTRQSLAEDATNIYNLIVNDIVDTAGNKILVPYPGTPFGDHPEAYGINILNDDWKYYDRRSYPVYSLNGVSADEIYYGYLHQEAALIEAYTQKIGATSFSHADVLKGLGYVYQHYVDAVW
jgi:radical SAM superfamily enzyme YgiQ (UPF0313 family)